MFLVCSYCWQGGQTLQNKNSLNSCIFNPLSPKKRDGICWDRLSVGTQQHTCIPFNPHSFEWSVLKSIPTWKMIFSNCYLETVDSEQSGAHYVPRSVTTAWLWHDFSFSKTPKHKAASFGWFCTEKIVYKADGALYCIYYCTSVPLH